MLVKRLQLPVLVAVIWVASFSPSYSMVGNEISEKALKNSLLMNESLLTKSSLARQVTELNIPLASESLNKARSLHKIALNKVSDGDLSGAVEARDESLRLLMVASRIANKASGLAEIKSQADYERKLESVNALLTAHKRITDSNSDAVTESKLTKIVTPLVNQAEKSAGNQEFVNALASLEKAYLLTADSIKAQRSGQTLVRSLDFATDKEAHEYELGRYENYQMLVNMMIDERRAFKRDARSQPFFDEADSYQSKANEFVAKGQYDQAAKLIEKASKSLVNMLRDAGVHIPGV